MPFAILGTDPTGAIGFGLASAAPGLEDWRVLPELGVAIVAVTGAVQVVAEQAIALLGERVAPRDAIGRLAVDPALVGWQMLLLDSKGQGAARSDPGCEPSFGHTTGTDH